VNRSESFERPREVGAPVDPEFFVGGTQLVLHGVQREVQPGGDLTLVADIPGSSIELEIGAGG
jgi:hypothetical protein